MAAENKASSFLKKAFRILTSTTITLLFIGLAGVVKAANKAVKVASKVTRGSIFVLSMDATAKSALQAEEDNLSCGSIEGALAA